MIVNGYQVRGARAMLRMTVAGLATAAQVSPNTVVRVEAEKPVNTSTLAAIQHALEKAGVRFTETGVELKGTP